VLLTVGLVVAAAIHVWVRLSELFYFHHDDLLQFSVAQEHGLSWDLLRLDVFGHFAPFNRLVHLFFVRVADVNLEVGALLVTGLVVALLVTTVWLCRELGLSYWRRTFVLVMTGFSVAVVDTAVWLDAALHILAALTVTYAVVAAHVRALRTGRRRWHVISVALFVAGFATQERTAFALPLIVLVDLFLVGAGRTWRERVALLWRSRWPLLAMTLLSVVAGALLGLHRGVTPLTGSLALVAGGASGLVAIARELGGDDRVVAVVQYLRVGLVTASMPVVVTLIYHADTSRGSADAVTPPGQAPWYLSLAMLVVLVLVGATVGRLIRLPGAGLLGPLALTVALEVSGFSFGLWVPTLLVQAGYVLIGWQAGLAFTRASLRAVGRLLPAAITLIVAIGVATAGLGVLLARVAGLTPLEGYLATSPGGVYAVLATAVETGSNVTFVIAAQVVRILMMLFAAPLLARAVVWASRRIRGDQSREITAASRKPIRVAD
jgi:membrane AbrB-like protein